MLMREVNNTLITRNTLLYSFLFSLISTFWTRVVVVFMVREVLEWKACERVLIKSAKQMHWQEQKSIRWAINEEGWTIEAVEDAEKKKYTEV